MSVEKKKYKYHNRVTATVKMGNLKEVNALSERTGVSASSIVNEALTEYFKSKKATVVVASKNSY